MYQLILKPILFRLDPEFAHHFTVKLFRIISLIPFANWIFSSLYQSSHADLEKEVFGLRFKNPVGLAAGFDKDGKYFKDMSQLGFGFIEIGTVTPKPQIGNPKPRLFRLPKDQALINRMGFNNEGVDALVERLKRYKKSNLIIGGNIGKNKVTPNEQAIDDYIYCFKKLHPYVDYFVVNVSSPNTPGLRALQDKGPLTEILGTLMGINREMEYEKPILLKIAPDLTNEQLDDIIEIVSATNIAGIIATNTTISRSNLSEDVTKIGAGGLSGYPLKDRSTEVIRYLSQKSKKAFPIIGVGGINDGPSAKEKLDAGADLIQVYSGLVYSGPTLVKEINSYLIKNRH